MTPKNKKDAERLPDTTNAIRPTGIDELDKVLHGGIPSGADILLSGGAGTGKTILSLQWLFAGYDKYKEPGLYISLTEPISKTLRNAEQFSFFKKDQVGPLQVYFTDMRGIMEGMDINDKELTFADIAQITSTLKLMVEKSGAKRVVIDSITAMSYMLKEKDKIREFIFRLGMLLSQLDTEVLLISEVPKDGYSVFGTEEFISDGIIKLSPIQTPGEIVRQLEIVKMRGISYESIPLTFKISNEGLVFFPHLSRLLTYPTSSERITTGTKGLGQMTSGGFLKGSATLISGPSGTGKTILGLQFLVSGLNRGESCLMISYEESQDQLIQLAKSFGWDLKPMMASGKLEFICAYPEEFYLDEHIDRIKQKMEKLKTQRVLVDSLSAIQTVYSSELLSDFSSRIISHLKQSSITSLFTLASESLMGSQVITNANLSTLYDNLILLRYVEIQSELKHMLLVLKTRGASHDKKMRELVFTPNGAVVSIPFTGIQGALSGEASKVSASAEELFHGLLLDLLGPSGEIIFTNQKTKGLSYRQIEVILDDFVKQGVISQQRKDELTTKFEKSLA